MITFKDFVIERFGNQLDNFERTNALGVVGTYFNLIEEGIEELNDSEISKLFNQLQNKILEKRTEIMEKEISDVENTKEVMKDE